MCACVCVYIHPPWRFLLSGTSVMSENIWDNSVVLRLWYFLRSLLITNSEWNTNSSSLPLYSVWALAAGKATTDLSKGFSQLIMSIFIFSQFFFEEVLLGGKALGYSTLIKSWFVNFSAFLSFKRKAPYHKWGITLDLCFIVISRSTSGARYSREWLSSSYWEGLQ